MKYPIRLIPADAFPRDPNITIQVGGGVNRTRTAASLPFVLATDLLAKYGVKFWPEGVIPHDPNVIIRLPPVVEPEKEEEVIVEPTCDFDFAATFDGTGDLAGYVPEIGETPTVPVRDNTLVGNSAGLTGGLAALVRVTSGSWQIDHDNGTEPQLIVFQPGNAPVSADYRKEIVIALPPGGVDMDIAICGRGQPSIYEATILRCIGAVFQIDGTGGNTARNVSCYVDNIYDDEEPTFDNSFFETIELGAATSVRLSAEFEGRQIRVYVDDALIGTVNWTDSTEFDDPGVTEWQFDIADFGAQYSNIQIESMSRCLLP